MVRRTGFSADRQPTISDYLAIHIRTLLSRRGISVRALGEMVFRQPQYTYQRLNGVVPIDVNDLVLFAKVLDIPPLELLTAALDAHAQAQTVAA